MKDITQQVKIIFEVNNLDELINNHGVWITVYIQELLNRYIKNVSRWKCHPYDRNLEKLLKEAIINITEYLKIDYSAAEQYECTDCVKFDKYSVMITLTKTAPVKPNLMENNLECLDKHKNSLQSSVAHKPINLMDANINGLGKYIKVYENFAFDASILYDDYFSIGYIPLYIEYKDNLLAVVIDGGLTHKVWDRIPSIEEIRDELISITHYILEMLNQLQFKKTDTTFYLIDVNNKPLFTAVKLY